ERRVARIGRPLRRAQRPEGVYMSSQSLERVTLPANVRVGAGSVITNENAFRRFFSERDPALTIGDNSTMEVVHFAIGKEGRIQIGDYCYITDTVLLCEEELR